MESKSKIKLVAFDLDGTIYNGDQLIDGALDTIDYFLKIGKKVKFFTNNSSKTRTQLFNKLHTFSIKLTETDVFSCSYAISKYLRRVEYKNIYVVGSKDLISELSNQNVKVIDNIINQQIDALLIGMDLNFDYTSLTKAYEVLQRNKQCKIIVCNMDYNFPVENGFRKPGCGAIASSILAASGRNFDFMIGKPNSYILDLIGKENNVLYENMLIIGDSFDSDILMAKNANAKSILIDDSGSSNFESKFTVKSIKEVRTTFENYYS